MNRRHALALLAASPLARPWAARAQATEVNFLLPSIRFLTAFAPHNLAEARGYYAANGVKPNFITLRGGAAVATQVGAGNAPMGGGIGDTPIIVRPNGVPVRAVMALGGGALVTVVARKDRGINSLRDLAGKKISVQSVQDTTYYSLIGAMGSVGLTPRSAEIQSLGPAGVWQAFVAGTVDAMAAVPDWIVDAEAEGVPVTRLSNRGNTPSMAQVVIASDNAIRTQKEPIAATCRALLRALADLQADPEAASADLVAFLGRNGAPVQAPRVLATLKLYNEGVYTDMAVPGRVDEARMDLVQRFYVDAGIIPRASPLADLYTHDLFG
ncbi:ABC transporter substrate-binding protein [Muricoccus aerilatus]|uniref:ABC transporter substrate-binding protein n=1 Tax=Muricoccus aerilatus TaxID=452982 RepID=UPI0005C192E1|nr:ABC transporter substrate-binding protein [Roseomonas aerilata]